MVAIVSGNSLGLSLTSKSTLGQSGNLGAADKGRSGEQSYVNMATGNLVLQRRDDYLVSTGEDVSSVRTYNSQGALSGGGWSYGVQRKKLEVFTGAGMGNYLMRTDEDGAVARYDFNGATGTYLSTAGAGSYDSLQQQADGSWSWTDGDTGLQEIYSSTGQLTRVIDPNGNAVNYSYSNGLISVVRNASGESTYYDYTNGNISRIRVVRGDGQTTSRVSYGYDAANRLSQVLVDLTPEDLATVGGGTYGTSYAYDGASNRIASITQQDGTKLSITYVQVNNDWRVATVTDSLNQKTQYSYDVTNRRTTVTDASGKSSSYSYDLAGQLTGVRIGVENGGSSWIGQTTISYNDRGDVTSMVDGTNNNINFSYDSHGNQIRSEDGLGNTKVSTYDSRNQLLTQTVSGRDTQALTTRNVYDATGRNQLRFTVSPQGRVVEFRYNAQGQKTSAIQYGAAAMDMATLATIVLPSEAQMVTWAAGQNKQQTLRTDTTYDFRGQLSSTTTYQSVDSQGNGLLGATTQYVYGQAGELLKTIQPLTGTVAQYTYDGLGRVTTATMPSSDGTSANTTSTVYDDAGGQITTTNASGLSTTSAYDRAGRLVSATNYAGNNASGDTSRQVENYAYDAAGRLVMVQDATGARRWIVYDAAGRKVADVDREGAVTEYLLDEAGRVIGTLAYAKPLATTATPSQDQIHALASTADRRTRNLYDAAGRVLYSVAANGAVTRFDYDSASRIVKTVAFAQTIDPSRLATVTNLTVEPPASPEHDRTTRNYYDADGLLRATVDAENAVTELRYDAAGRLTDRVRYQYYIDSPVYTDAITAPAVSPLAAASNAIIARGRYLYIRKNDGVNKALSFGEVQIFDGAGNNIAIGKTVTSSTAASGTANKNTNVIDGNRDPVSGVFLSSATQSGWLQIDLGSVQDVSRVEILGRTQAGATDSNGEFMVYLAATSMSNKTPTQLESQTGVWRYRENSKSVNTLIDALTINQIGGTLSSANLLRRSLPWTPTPGSNDLRDRILYNARGQKTAEIDAVGYMTEFVYDDNGNQTRSIRYATALTATTVAGINGGTDLTTLRPAASAQDQVTIRTYDALNRVVSETDFQATVTSYKYDAGGRLIQTDKAAGFAEVRTLAAHYDVRGRLIGELSAEGAALLTGNQTQTQIDAIWAQHGLAHTYDAVGRRTSTTDQNNLKTVFYYDLEGRLTTTVNALGEISRNVYDAFGQKTKAIGLAQRIVATNLTGGLQDPAFTAKLDALSDPVADTLVAFTYNTDGTVASATKGINASNATADVTTFTYDAFGREIGRVETFVGGRSVTRSSTYDRRGLLIESVDDVGNLGVYKAAEYDAFGRVSRSEDANGNWTSYEYDKLGRVIATTDPLKIRQATTYDAFDRVVSRTDGLLQTTKYTYDTSARSVAVTTPEGITVTTSRNRFGQIVSVRDGNNNVTNYEYDRNGQAVSTATSLGRQTDSYDRAGRLVDTVDANGTVVHMDYDAANRVLRRVVDPSGLNLVTAYTYNARGQRVTITDPNGSTTRLDYNANGDLVRQVVDVDRQADGYVGLKLTTLYKYDGRGKTLSVTDPNGIATIYTYDNLGRRVLEVRDPSTADHAGLNLSTRYLYDAASNLVAVTDPLEHLTRYGYDADNRLRFVINAAGDFSETAYDAEGRVTRVTKFAARVKNTTVDSLDAETSATQWASLLKNIARSSSDNVENRVYDRDGRLTYTVDGNGSVVRMNYDGNGNVIERREFVNRLSGWTSGTPAPVEDATDRITRTIYDAANRARYSIDALGGVVTQRYDANGNVTERIAYATRLDIATQPIPSGATDGEIQLRLAYIADSQRDTHTRYRYDAAGRLSLSANGAGAVTAYTYDRNGNLQQQRVYSTSMNDYYWNDEGITGYVSTTQAAGRHGIYRIGADGTSGALIGYVADVASANTTPLYLLRNADGAYLYTADPKDVGAARALGWTMSGDGIVGHIDKSPAAGNTAMYRLNRTNNTAHFYSTSKGEIDFALLPGPMTPSSGDRVVRHVFDGANREILSIDSAGFATEMRHDATSNITQTYGFATALSAANLDALDNAQRLRPGLGHSAIATYLTPGAADRATRHVFDAARREVFTIDAEGAVTAFVYDGVGQVTATKQYATLLSSAAATQIDNAIKAAGLAQPSAVAALVSGDAKNDRVTRRYYDESGNLLYSRDALGNLRGFTYDGVGRKLSATTYAVSRLEDFWTSEGITGYVSKEPAAGKTALYHLSIDRGVNSDWMFTTSASERDALVASGWLEEDVTGYIGTSKTDDSVPLFRLAYPGTTFHYFTADPGLRDYAVQQGWIVESTIGYVDRAPAVGNAPMFQLNQTGQKQHFYATNGRQIDLAKLPSFVANADDQTESFTYDSAGRVVTHNAETKTLATNEQFLYDGTGKKTSYINQKGAQWFYSYDASGNLTREVSPTVQLTGLYTPANTADAPLAIDPASATFAGVITQMAYDAMGRLTSRTEGAGRTEQRTTRYEYDSLGRQVKTVFPDVRVYLAESPLQLYANGRLGPAARSETVVSLSSETRYDVFGNAVASRNTAGDWSYKAYDAAGRLAFDVDALGYVTGYTRNAWGDTTSLMRYAEKSSLPVGAANEFSRSAVLQATAANDHSRDRDILTTYDRLGRTVMVQQPQADHYDSSSSAARIQARATVRQNYNAFGDVVRIDTLKNPGTGEWNITHHFYDKRGSQIATVDAEGYLTSRQYDVFGRLFRSTESAVRLSPPAWTVVINPATAIRLDAPTAAANEKDRSIRYGYDRLNRKTSETREHVQVTDWNATNTVNKDVDLTTSYGYDAVGNLVFTTDAMGATSYSYYDALGRVTSVVGPKHAIAGRTGDASTVTDFIRDAYGNALVTIQRATATGRADAQGFDTVGDNDADRVTFTRFDAHGHAATMTDAAGKNINMSYDAAGRLAKQWRTVTDLDGKQQTLYTAYAYDKLGRQTHIFAPFKGGALDTEGLSTTARNISDTELSYNAFGELTTRSIRQDGNAMEGVEYYDYDNAGRVWRSNAGGGVDKVRLFDMQGNQTVEIVASGGNEELTGVRSTALKPRVSGVRDWTGAFEVLSAVEASGANFRRTDKVYDRLGHLVDTIAPGRQSGIQQPVAVGSDNFLSAEIVSSSDQVSTFANGIKVNWSPLKILGSGDVRIKLTYRSKAISQSDGQDPPRVTVIPGVVSDRLAYLTAEEALKAETDSGYTLQWQDDKETNSPRGADAILSVVVSKKDVFGVWQQVYSSVPGAAPSSNNENAISSKVVSSARLYGDMTNRVDFTWSTLNNPEGADVRINLSYRTMGISWGAGNADTPSVQKDRVVYVSAGQAASGYSVQWQDTAQNSSDPVGIEKVLTVVVSKKDVSGNWRQIYSVSPGGTPSGTPVAKGNWKQSTTIDVGMPADLVSDTIVEYRPRAADGASPAAWTAVRNSHTLPVQGLTHRYFALPSNPVQVAYGSSYRFNLRELQNASGTYEYRVRTIARDGVEKFVGSGTLSAGLTTQSAGASPGIPKLPRIDSSVGTTLDIIDNQLHQVLRWQTPPAGTDVAVRRRRIGATDWLGPVQEIFKPADGRSDTPAGFQEAAIDIDGSGDLEYELTFKYPATDTKGAFTAHAVGKYTVTAVPPSVNADTTPNTLPKIASVSNDAVLVDGTVYNVIKWPQPAAGTFVQIRFIDKNGTARWMSQVDGIYSGGANSRIGLPQGWQGVPLNFGSGDYDYQLFFLNSSGQNISSTVGKISIPPKIDAFNNTVVAGASSFGWVDEGIIGYIYTQRPYAGKPLMRWAAQSNSAHFFIADDSQEMTNYLSNNGWKPEGIAGYVNANYPGAFDSLLYRLWQPNTNLHYYTTDLSRVQQLVANGWTREADQGYISRVPVAGTKPLYQMYLGVNGDRLYTADKYEHDYYLSASPNSTSSPTVTSQTGIFQGMRTAVAKIDNRSYNVLEWVEPPGARVRVYDGNGNEVTNQPDAANRVFANGGGRATLDNGFAKAVIVDAVGTSYYRFMVEYPASDPGGLRVAEAMVRVEVPAGGGSTSAVAFTDTTPPYAAKIANVRIGADNIDGTLHQTLLWQKPAAGATTSLKMRLAGATQWLQPQPGIYSLGDNRSSPPADAQEAPIGIYGPGDYEYELVITAADGTLSKATGRFTIFAKTSSSHTDTTALYLGSGPDYDAGLPAGSVRPRVHQTVDRWGNVLEANDPRLAWETGAWRTKYEYNDSNQLIKQSRPQDTNEGDAVTEIYYDKLGRQTGVKDARGNVNKDIFDAAGQLVAKRFADGGQQDFGYNVFGDKVSSAELFQTGRTVVTNFGYDKLARLTTSSLAGVTSAWKYTVGAGFNPDANGDNGVADNVSMERGEQRTLETIRYDEAGRKLRVITGDDDARVVGNADKRLDGTTLLYTRYDYDLAGNIVRTGTEDRAGNLIVFPAVSQFDSLGRKITQTTQRINGSATEAWRYDMFGKLVAQSTYRLDPANSAYQGSVNITYRYNNAGELVHKDSTAGQNIDYAYDGAGQITGIVDRHLGQTSTYAYDLAGNRLIEQVKQQTVLAGGGIAEVVYQDNHLAYDSQSRLRQVANGQTKVFIDYDKAGNRTRVQTQVSNVLYDAATGTRTEKWEQKDVNTFGYDAMNRQTSGDNVEYRYDLAGNRIFEDRHDGRATTFAYDDLHRIWEGRQNGTVVFEQRYDQAGRVVYSKSQVNVYNMPNRWAPEYRYNVYGSDGRMYDTRVVLRNGSGPFNLIQSDDIHYHFYDASVRGDLGYDAAGNLRGYAVETYVMPDNANNIAEEHRRVITSYQYDHIGDQDVQVKADTLREQLNRRDMGLKQDVRSKQDTWYDANGFMSNKQQTDPKLNRTFVNDSAGRALYINEGAGTTGEVGSVRNGNSYIGGSTGSAAEPGHVMRQLVVNGEVLGRYGDAAVPSTTRKYDSLAEFNLQAPAINTGPGGSDAIQYTVSGQESLRSIAGAVLGDANLWFRIAEANGLAASDSAKLDAGTTLRIPRITLNANRVDTFTPYDPSKAVGGSDPALPNLPAPQGKGGGCGGFGQIIMVAVAVVATIYTAGALSGALYGVSGSVFQAGVGVLSAGTAGTAGAITAVGGAGSLGAIGIAAGGAAVGSIASQAAGNLLGVQSGFSWNQVALSALAGGVGAGLQGGAAGGASQLSDAARFGNAVGNAALGNAITQGVGIATGLQRSFDWKGVAASAVAGGVAQATGGAFRTAFGEFGGRVATSLVSGTAAAVMRGGRVAVQQVAADVFGNVLGSDLVAGSVPAPFSGTTGDFARMDGAGYRSAPYDASQTGGMTTLFDGSTISDAENLRRIASARASGPLYASSDVQDPTQRQVMSDAGNGWRKAEEGWLEKSGIDVDGTTTVRAKRDTGFDPLEVDRQVRDGNFNAFYAIGGAIADGRLGDAWKYATYTPSQQARDSAYARVFPGQGGSVTAISDKARMNSSGFQLGGNLATGFIGGALASPPGLAAGSLVAGFGLGTNLQLKNYAGAAGNALEIGANLMAAGAGKSIMAGIRAGRTIDSLPIAAFGNVEKLNGLRRTGPGYNANFASESLLNSHFAKHGAEFKVTSPEDYLNIGRDVMNNGQPVEYFYKAAGEARTGYVSFARNRSSNGEALFDFVGTNKNGSITTIHTKSRTDLFDLLGDDSQSALKAFRTDTIGPNPQNGWKWPYSG